MKKSILGSFDFQKVGAVLNTVAILSSFFAPFLINISIADAATFGPNTASTVVGNGSGAGSISWTASVSSLVSQDSSYATADLNTDNASTSYLNVTNFGFSVPAGATINGVEVQVRRVEDGPSTDRISDNSVRLIVGGSVSGNNKATTTPWGQIEKTVTYGGPSDTWGASLTPTNISASNFGLAFSAKHDNTNNNRTASVNFINITVYYTAGLATTTTGVSCTAVTYGASSTCTTTVTRGSSTSTPTGSVTFTTGGSGTFTPSSTCALSGSGTSTTCSVTYTPSSVGSGTHLITGNYFGDSNFSTSTGNQSLAVAKKTVAATAVANSKGYDGTTSATAASCSVAGVVGGDTLNCNVASTTSSFSDKNVGTGKIVTVTGIKLGGASSSSYVLSTTTATTTANITARAITVKAAPNTKVYDATTTASAVPTITSGTLATGDTTSTLSEFYTSKTVGAGKTLTPTGTINDGNSGANYTVSFVNNTSGVITAKSLTISALGQNKVYDGTTEATTTLSSNVLASDTISISATSSFATASIGTGKTISVSGIVASGADIGNYTQANTTTTTTGNITARPISVKADNKSKMFGDADPAFTYSITSSSLVASDTFSGSLSRVSGELVADYDILQGTLSAGSNYLLTFATGTLTIGDTTAPVFGSVPDLTVEASGLSGSTVAFSITATDNVDATVTPTCSPISGSLFPITTTAVNCTVTDSHSNTATTTFNITVQDTTAPALTLNGSATSSLHTGDTYTELGATALDTVDGDRTSAITSSTILSPATPVSEVTTTIPGTYVVTYSVSDLTGNTATTTRFVFVSDLTAPVIVAIPDVTAEATGPTGAAVTYDQVTATDDVDASSSLVVSCTPTSGSVFTLGTTTVVCSTMDSSSNPGSGAGLSVRVVDTTPPTITLNGSASTTLTVGDTYTELGAVVDDLVDGTSTATVGGDTVLTNAPGVFQITYNATDTAGNAATTTYRTVTVNNAATTTLTITFGSEAPGGAGASVTVGETTTPYSEPVVLNNADLFNATATPVAGYSVNATGTCSGTATAGGPYNCSFEYSQNQYEITASAGANGSISPTGTVNVLGGNNQTFTITPNSGFQVSGVLVDGVSVGGVSTYTFSSVVASHTIQASFSAIPSEETPPPSGGGSTNNGGGSTGGGGVVLVPSSNPTPAGPTGNTTGGGTTGNNGTGNGVNGGSDTTIGGTTGGNGSGNGNGQTGNNPIVGNPGGGNNNAGGNTGGNGGGGVTENGGGIAGGVLAGATSSGSTSTDLAGVTSSTAQSSLLASIFDGFKGNMNLWWLILLILLIMGMIYYFSRD